MHGQQTGRPGAGRPTIGPAATVSDLDSDGADPADLELPASPPGNRHEEHRELLELPYARPLRGVAAAQAGTGLPGPQVLLLGAEAEEQEHVASPGRGPITVRRVPTRPSRCIDCPRMLRGSASRCE